MDSRRSHQMVYGVSQTFQCALEAKTSLSSMWYVLLWFFMYICMYVCMHVCKCVCTFVCVQTSDPFTHALAQVAFSVQTVLQRNPSPNQFVEGYLNPHHTSFQTQPQHYVSVLPVIESCAHLRVAIIRATQTHKHTNMHTHTPTQMHTNRNISQTLRIKVNWFIKRFLCARAAVSKVKVPLFVSFLYHSLSFSLTYTRVINISAFSDLTV